MVSNRVLRGLLVVLGISLILLGGMGRGTPASEPVAAPPLAPTVPPILTPAPLGLPLPSSLPLTEYEPLIYNFLGSFAYKHLGWHLDKGVRDTGPFIDNNYYGTHPVVRIFYSPEVYDWMKSDRKAPLRDGAMFIKEMYPPPAIQYAGMDDATLQTKLIGITVMVRDSQGSKDGWFWGYWGPNQIVDNNNYPFDYPNMGFGQYCTRCHASAENEFAFASLRNIAGEPGEPIKFRVDDSWIKNEPVLGVGPGTDLGHEFHPQLADALFGIPLTKSPPSPSPARPNPQVLEHFGLKKSMQEQDIVPLPGMTYDHVIVGPNGPEQFITSDQCMACHDGAGRPFGPNMFIPAQDGKGPVNLSPFGEWNWSMMGLAGRDPIFYAQLESELAYHPQGNLPQTIQDTCLRCHGVMGQRQFHIDQPNGGLYSMDVITVTDQTNPKFKYGALSRDGISCTVCHQVVDKGKPIQEVMTGQFEVSKPGEFEPGISRIYGPFDDLAVKPMETTLGMKPVKSDFIKSSQLCGSCHLLNVPIYDAQGVQHGTGWEQTTYLEWLNSDYRDELGMGAVPKTCQDCHMPNEYHTDDGQAMPLKFRIANIQDDSFPEADHRRPIEEITIKRRDDFARHTLAGINVFALEMFNQFDKLLGVRKQDYMTGSKNGLPFAIEQGVRFATKDTADVTIQKITVGNNRLDVDVKVTNKTGHRLPSGVGFRRAFLEFKVLDVSGAVVWASGRTNALGVIVDQNGQPLQSESFPILNPTECAADPSQCRQKYEPHYQVITGQDQVQIYEELSKNPEGKLTTSFLALDEHIKDNRLLPLGWTLNGPPGYNSDPVWGPRFVEATAPQGNVLEDAQFQDGTGSDVIIYQVPLPANVVAQGRVVATLYYQSIPPAYLKDRFTTANGPHTQRLQYIVANLNLDNTAIDGWKLKTGSDSQPIPAP